MTLEFFPAALDVFRKIKDCEPELAEKIKLLLKDVLEHPDSGVGTPVRMSGRYAGVWARKISFENTLYYVFNEEKVVVLSIKLSSGHFTKSTETLPDSGGLVVEAFSDEDYSSVLALMQANRGKDAEPKVGIFWYNRARNELFGVVSHKLSDYSKANASDGRITCSEMHEDVWKREFRKQKYHGDSTGPYIGAYQDKPRGRVFYNMNEDRYEVAVGKWIEDFPAAYQLVLEEFNLPKEKTSIKYAIHWDIGMSWR